MSDTPIIRRPPEVSINAINLIKGSEEFRSVAYAATEFERQKGIWTIAWGHTKNVKEHDTCTIQQGDGWLLQDINECLEDIDACVIVELNQGQLDALVSWVFNFGRDHLKESTLLHKLNQGDYAGAAEELPKWIHQNGKVLPGLVIRREKERKLFMEGV